jgi:hypothetical protein
MKWMIAILPLIACTLLFASGKGSLVSKNAAVLVPFADTVNNDATLASYVSFAHTLNRSAYSLKDLDIVLQENKNTQFLLGSSQEGRKINAYYIPGTSNLKALVIAGVHGSELSSVEVAYRLLSQLLQGKQPYYSVIIVPSLFPDNAFKAMNQAEQIGSKDNIGRYSYADAVDPNRQMPSPGKAYNENTGVDHIGRTIEQENQWLLQLIQAFKPQRIANLHAIRDMGYGGVYADPRTDHRGLALGYSTDSSLAVDIASYIYQGGGNVAGNDLAKKPTALYYKDPVPAAAGNPQKRNMAGSALNAKRGSGVSLGTWASTSVANEKNPARNREAMRILTIEYPGYKRSADYRLESKQLFQQKQTELFAKAIELFFLGKYYTENENTDIVKK